MYFNKEDTFTQLGKCTQSLEISSCTFILYIFIRISSVQSLVYIHYVGNIPGVSRILDNMLMEMKIIQAFKLFLVKNVI